MRAPTLASLAGCLAFFVVSEAAAADVWSTPYDGVRLLDRTTTGPAERIHALEITLGTPGVRLEATTTAQRKQTPSAFGKLVSAQAAINGDFFSYTDYSTSGLAAGGGQAWPSSVDNTTYGNVVFNEDASRIELVDPSKTLAFDASWMWGVVSGQPLVLANGAVPALSSSFCTTRHPRTAVGLSKDSKKLWLVVIDGRSTASAGMTCAEIGTLLRGLGADRGLNLDGGGSSAMYVAGKGVVNTPSDGSERVVANHIALFAPKSGTVATIAGAVYESPTIAKKLAGVVVKAGAQGSDTTDATGAYSILVPPGAYDIIATKSGYVSAKVHQTIDAGATLKLDIPLEKSATATDIDGGVADGGSTPAQPASPLDAGTSGSAGAASDAPSNAVAGCGCRVTSSIGNAPVVPLAVTLAAALALRFSRRRDPQRATPRRFARRRR